MHKRHTPFRTIGVLSGWHTYEGSAATSYFTSLYKGILPAAREYGANLLVGCGLAHGTDGNLHRPAWPAWPDLQPESDFVPVGPENTDGLLVIGPLLHPIRQHYLEDLSLQGFPVLYINTGGGRPAITVDNEFGIRAMMDHLVGHGHRRIAFIAGEEPDRGDSRGRVEAFRKCLTEKDLETDARLIEFGQHWQTGGYQAMQRVLRSGAPFTAVMASNDLSAFGAIQALREAGLRVPWDVAVTGFDDLTEAGIQVPPLTTVSFPLQQIGQRAVRVLLEGIEDGMKGLPPLIRIEPTLALRESCGCLSEPVRESAISLPGGGPATSSVRHAAPTDTAQTMVEALADGMTSAALRDLRTQCDSLVESFRASLEDGDPSHFQVTMLEILQRIEQRNDEGQAWQSAITILREDLYLRTRDPIPTIQLQRAEDLLHQARAMLSESSRRRNARLQQQVAQQLEALGRLLVRLLSVADEEQIFNVLVENLHRVGVLSAHIVRFMPQEDDPVAGSELRSIRPGATRITFPTREFPPPDLFPEDEPYAAVCIPPGVPGAGSGLRRLRWGIP